MYDTCVPAPSLQLPHTIDLAMTAENRSSQTTDGISDVALEDERLEGSAATLVVGWREWIGMPALCDHQIKAKIDTGAKTSALHAFDLVVFVRDENTWARFEVHPMQKNNDEARIVESKIIEFRPVQSSNGASELRPVIETEIVVGPLRFVAEMTLTNRDQMGFRMLLGRSALQGRVLVDPSGSFCLGDADANIVE